MKRKKNIITNNKEIYEKLNMLNFSPEVLLTNTKKSQIDRILRNINKDNEVLNTESVGDYVLVRKHAPINFNIYLK